MTDRIAKQLLSLLLWGGVGILGVFLLRKTFFLLFPIFCALLFAEVIHGSLKRLRPLNSGAKRILTVLFLLIFFAFLSLLAVLITERLLHYGTWAMEVLGDRMGDITLFCKGSIAALEDRLSGFLKTDLSGRFDFLLPSLLQRAFELFAASIPGWIGSALTFLPRFFLSLIIFSVSCYYFACDRERILCLFGKVSEEKQKKLALMKELFLRTVLQYFRAYFLLFLLSFSQLFLGLALLGFRGAAGIALMIALIDLLPVLGCGTILLPWSLFVFLAGNTKIGWGLLILYLIILFVRQFAEPKILGSSIGLHPLFSLILVITGFALFGFAGMILLPLTGACLMKLREEEA